MTDFIGAIGERHSNSQKWLFRIEAPKKVRASKLYEVQQETDNLDIVWNGDGLPSDVGSLEVQLFQRDPKAPPGPSAEDAVEDTNTKATTSKDTTTEDTTAKETTAQNYATKENTIQGSINQDTSTEDGVPQDSTNFFAATRDITPKENLAQATADEDIATQDTTGLDLIAKDSSIEGGSAVPGSLNLAKRAPTLEDFASWAELNCKISNEGAPPPFEIG